MKIYSTLLIGVLVLGACGEQDGQSGSTARDVAAVGEQHKAVITRLYEVFNTGNMADVDELIAPNLIEHNMMPGVTGEGVEAFKQTVQIIREAFPDLHITADQMIAEGDFVAIRFTMSGTQNGPFMGAPPSGKHFKVSGIDFIRFENGKAAEHWGYQDELSMMQQLGMMSEEEMSEEEQHEHSEEEQHEQ